MYKFRKLLVAVDLTEMDRQLMRYTAHMAQRSDVSEIHFVKIAKNLDLPDGIKKEFPGIIDNALKDRKESLDKEVEDYFDVPKKVKITTNVIQGDSPSKKIVKLVEEHNIDLIICGWKSTSKGSSAVPQRLARRAPCSIMIVPETAKPSFHKLLIPIDFSDDAESAVEEAIDIARAYPEEDVIIFCQNVFTVPQGYHYSGKSFEDFAKLMKKNAEKSYQSFIKSIDTEGAQIKPVYSHDRNDNKVTDIRDLAEEVKPDFLILGTKCRSRTSALFIGNLAEKVIEDMGKEFPMLIVRPKNDKAGLLEYIREF